MSRKKAVRSKDHLFCCRCSQSNKPFMHRHDLLINPKLFQLENATELTDQLKIDRPFSLPGILLGTSAFTAAGWEGAFYPWGMQSRDFLSYYATQFAVDLFAKTLIRIRIVVSYFVEFVAQRPIICSPLKWHR